MEMKEIDFRNKNLITDKNYIRINLKIYLLKCEE